MFRATHRFLVIWLILISLVLGNCTPSIPTETTPPTINATKSTTPSITSSTQIIEPTPQVQTVNPLTGLLVADPSLLQLPAVLVSISHFPVDARPQAGLSFAPYVFEIYITEGTTRFLTTFYGEFPAPDVPIVGNCDVRREPFTQTDLLLGNQVWLDLNENNIRDAWERGVGGVCVNLYAKTGALLQQTTTDSNGYYGFNVEPGKYFVAFLKPPEMEFDQKDAGEEETDSDVDPGTGYTDAVDVTSSLLHVDVGLIPLVIPPPTSELAPAKVGPVRSGRLIYADIADFFPDSCLIYAYASAEVLVHLPKCFFVNHDIQGGGYMLDIAEMVKLAKESKKPDQEINYESNVYADEPPAGGVDASKLHVYIAWLNQSEWLYDPLYESWWRYVDNADEQTAGVVHPEVDRLTKRQLHFENVIILYAKHDVVTPETTVAEESAGQWLLQFSQPPGAK